METLTFNGDMTGVYGPGRRVRLILDDSEHVPSHYTEVLRSWYIDGKTWVVVRSFDEVAA